MIPGTSSMLFSLFWHLDAKGGEVVLLGCLRNLHGQGQACYLFVLLMLGSCFYHLAIWNNLLLWFVRLLPVNLWYYFPMFVMQCTYFHIYVTAVYVIVWYVSGHT